MAIVPCKECGNDISTEAKACPKCGAPPPKAPPGSFFGAGAKSPGCLFIGAAIFLGLMVFGGSYKTPTASPGKSGEIAELLAKQPQCRSNLDQVIALGTTTIDDQDGYTVAHIDEAVWAGLYHDDRVRQALLIFCAKMPADGHYSVLVKGRHDNKNLASVTDGQYSD